MLDLKSLIEAGRLREARARFASLNQELRNHPLVARQGVHFLIASGDTARALDRSRKLAQSSGASVADRILHAECAQIEGLDDEVSQVVDDLRNDPALTLLDCLDVLQVLARVAGPEDSRCAHFLPGSREVISPELPIDQVTRRLTLWSRRGWHDLTIRVWEGLSEAYTMSTTIPLGFAQALIEASCWERALATLHPVLQDSPGHFLARLLEVRCRRMLRVQKMVEIQILLSSIPIGDGVIRPIEFVHEGQKFTASPSQTYRDIVTGTRMFQEGELLLSLAEFRFLEGDLDGVLILLQRRAGAFGPGLQSAARALRARVWASKRLPDLAVEEFEPVEPRALVAEEDESGLMVWVESLLVEGHNHRALAVMDVVPPALRWPGYAENRERAARGTRTLLEPIDDSEPRASGCEEGEESEVIDGTYTVLECVGRGGMSEVLRVVNRKLGRIEALKILPRGKPLDDGIANAALNEARSLATLDHRNVIRIYAAGVHEKRPYLTMEFVEGETLGSRLNRQGALELKNAVICLTQVAEGLLYVHACGFVHRDIKPDNIMLLPDCSIKLMDFGLARRGPSEESLLVQDGVPPPVGDLDPTLTGTLHYLAPELINGEAASSSSDIYSFGIVAYEALTGRAPFDSQSPHSLLFMHLTKVPEPVSSLRKGIPEDLTTLISECLAKAPKDRPSDFASILARLRTFS